MIKRKGAKSTKDIPKDVMEQLNRGEMETANLVEWLAVDQKKLLENLLNQNNRIKYLQAILDKISNLPKQTVNTINEVIGTELLEFSNIDNDDDILQIISTHKSDVIRCWATYTIGKNTAFDINEKLLRIQPFSADNHFGVREISWLAVRKSIAGNLKESIAILSKWTSNDDENIRRFASEATRPRGVWCEHIEELKQNPELGLPILEPLKSDMSKYVQDSVGNWLNDASKTQPNFVKNLCWRWEKESNTKQTKYIVKKALRTIQSNADKSSI